MAETGRHCGGLARGVTPSLPRRRSSRARRPQAGAQKPQLPGGVQDAQALFGQLSEGGEVVTDTTYKGTLVRLPNGGTVGFRTSMTRSPDTAATIDVNIPGLPIAKIKFNP
jgi:hypothetical protein